MIGLADRDRRSKQLQLESGIQDLLDTYIEAYNVWRELCAECPRSVDICARHVPFVRLRWIQSRQLRPVKHTFQVLLRVKCCK